MKFIDGNIKPSKKVMSNSSKKYIHYSDIDLMQFTVRNFECEILHTRCDGGL